MDHHRLSNSISNLPLDPLMRNSPAFSVCTNSHNFLMSRVLSFNKLTDLLLLCFCRVTKGVSELPGNLQSAASNVNLPSPKAIMYFCIFLATGFFFILLAFLLFLPLIVLVPQKFAISFTLGCGFIVGSFFALRGPKNQFAHMISKEVNLSVSRLRRSPSLRLFFILILFNRVIMIFVFLSHV